jgi:hypothetical protein
MNSISNSHMRPISELQPLSLPEGKTLLGGWVLTLGALVASPEAAKLLAKHQICANTLLTQQALRLIEIYAAQVGKLAALPFAPLSSILSSKAIAAGVQIITTPSLEEFGWSFLFQELLLRRLPKEILNRFAPDYAPLVDAKAARIARVILRTMLFAVSHAAHAQDNANPCLGSNYVFAVMGLGAALGTFAELWGTKASLLLHIANNAIAYSTGNQALR